MVAIIVSLVALSAFLVQTQLIWSPLILFAICIFLLYPYRKESRLARRIIFLTILLFVGWLIIDLGIALMPFFISFMLAYLLDPVVAFLAKRKIPRWASSLFFILTFIGLVTLVAVFVVPSIFLQIDKAISELSSLVTSVHSYLNSDEFYHTLQSLGINKETIQPTIEGELMPRLENVMKTVLVSLGSLFENLSGIASQIINAILIPVLAFYFLKDFNKLKQFLKSVLMQKNKKFLFDLRRINKILRVYITWQITAAIIVATFCSTFFSIFHIPYAIVLGVICGFLNPIPYLGVLASIVVVSVAILLVSPDNVLPQIIIAVSVISVMHFINAYFLEPNIAGRQVGLHPLLLIASLFVFGGIFGFIGLLIAVPCTATLMMFFNDWRESSIRQQEIFTP